MIFHEVVRKPTITAGADEGEKELKLRVTALVVWIVATIVLVLLAFLAQSSNWATGADKILEIAAALVGGGGVGLFFGEKNASKEAGVLEGKTTSKEASVSN